jgi:segregation and condensation protein A
VTVSESQEPTSSAYQVRLPVFEGPLDLLLHLIRVNEMDIFDIPIVEVTRQYQESLDMMRRLDLEVAGEFVLMAATLMHIKSKLLLPRDPEPGGEESEDPRAELTRQLVEYQRLKQGAENLQALESVASLVWTRGERVFEEFEGERLLVVDMVTLLGAMKKVLDRLEARARFELRSEEFSVAEKVDWLSGRLAAAGSLSFFEILDSTRSRAEAIATFLAILELMRMRRLLVLQRAAFEDIILAPAPASPEEIPS